MKKILSSRVVALAILALLAGTRFSSAQIVPIPVPNNDLQIDPTLLADPNFSTVQDVDASGSVLQFFVETHTGPGHYGSNGVTAPDGTTAAFVNTDGAGTIFLNNDLTAGGVLPATTYVAGDTYTFTLSIGNQPGAGGYSDPGNVAFGFLSNGALAGQRTLLSSDIPEGNGVNALFTDFTFSYTATAADDGQAIGLGISITSPNGGGSQTELSDIRLDDVGASAPEPSTWAMLLAGFGVLLFIGRLRSKLV